MTVTHEQIQALKSLCVKAGGEEWVAFVHSPSSTCSVHTPGDERCGDVIKWAGFDGQKNAKAKAKFIAAANPAAILSLLAERDADKALIAELKNDVDAANARVDAGCAQLCNQDEEIEMLRQRIAELESRTNDAWIAHDGLSRPHSLGKNDLVYLKTRTQELSIPYPAGRATGWFHSGGDMDIVAYKPAEASTLTVKLPDEKFAYGETEYDDGFAYGWNANNREVARVLKDACTAAGITLDVGE